MAWRYTEVDGTTFTGLYAGDGSFNIVINDGLGPIGVYHPCGAYRVATSDDDKSFYHANGSINDWVFGGVDGAPGWVPTGAALALDFEGDQYYDGDEKEFSDLITFSRASLATMYDSTGKLTYAPANYVRESQTLTTSPWAVDQMTSVTANAAVAPDGTTTAELCTPNNNQGTVYQPLNSDLPSTTNFIASLYVKPGTATRTALLIYNTTLATIVAECHFNWSGGVPSHHSSGGSASNPTVSDEGNGWYRLSMKFTGSASAVAANRMQNYPDTAGTNGTAYFWGAQVEPVTYETAPRAYNVTTSAAYHGPRLDYNPSTLAARGLLVEEARTNLQTFSEDFSNATWVQANLAAITTNTAVSPDGTSNADKLVPNTTNTWHSIVSSQAKAASAITYTASVYAKADGYSGLDLEIGGSVGLSNGAGVSFNLADGTAGAAGTYGASPFTAASATITSVGNGWYRCTLTATSNTQAVIAMWFGVQSVAGTSNFAGDGTSGILLYGAQLEVSVFASSYIPTTSAAATRAVELPTIANANFTPWYNATEGTFVIDVLRRSNAADRYMISTGTDSFAMIAEGAGFTATALRGVTYLAQFAPDAPVNVQHKIAGAYKVSDHAITYDGSTPATSNNATALGTASALGILHDGIGGGSHFNGWIKSLDYYNTRKSNADLITLTA